MLGRRGVFFRRDVKYHGLGRFDHDADIVQWRCWPEKAEDTCYGIDMPPFFSELGLFKELYLSPRN